MGGRLEATVRFGSLGDLDVVLRHSYIPAQRVSLMLQWQQVVVAEHGGGLVGSACFDYLWGVTPFLAQIWVFEEYRRRGVGRAMLQYLEGYFLERGHEVLYSSSRVDELPPQAWHRHMGFEECGFLAALDRSDAGEVFFRKRLR